MFVARLRQLNQAPSGAACRATQSSVKDMPLLTELENDLADPRAINMTLLTELCCLLEGTKWLGKMGADLAEWAVLDSRALCRATIAHM